MRRLTVEQVHERKVAELGLDPSAVDLMSIEAIAGALRRAASNLCPCSGSTLVRNVVEPLRGLVGDMSGIKEQVELALEAIVAHGDLLECVEAVDGRPSRLIYAAPAAFVMRQSGTAMLLGITSDQLSALPESLQTRIQYVHHVRWLHPLEGEELVRELVELGLIELSHDSWLKAPRPGSPTQHRLAFDRLLDAAGPSRDIPGLSLLDPTSPVRYYPGRWREPRSQTGRFVGRRAQAYGADLWSYVQLHDGNPEKLIDLPLLGSRWRGCDEAWYLQLAIDAERGQRQRFRRSRASGDAATFEVFSPVPMWARRRWDAVGEPVTLSGCLFAYRFDAAELAEEVRFARDVLWLEETR